MLRVVLVLGHIVDNHTTSEILIRCPHHVWSWWLSKVLLWEHITTHGRWEERLLSLNHVSIITQRHWKSILPHSSICLIMRLVLISHIASIHSWAIISLIVAILISHGSLHIWAIIHSHIHPISMYTWGAKHAGCRGINSIGSRHLCELLGSSIDRVLPSMHSILSSILKYTPTCRCWTNTTTLSFLFQQSCSLHLLFPLRSPICCILTSFCTQATCRIHCIWSSLSNSSLCKQIHFYLFVTIWS